MRLIRVNVVSFIAAGVPMQREIRVWGVRRGPVNLNLYRLEPLEVAAKLIQTIEHLKAEHHPCEIEIMPDARKVIDLPKIIRSEGCDT
jgi:hypothetical protein